jgi:L-threonylcarbamoyladenylate synthase
MEIDKILLELHQGKSIIIATDTLFALSCDATNPFAVANIYTIKKRHPDKKLPVLFKDIEAVQVDCILHPILEKLAYKFWPGPLTLLLQIKQTTSLASAIYDNNSGIIAARVPGSSPMSTILTRYNQPLIGTSANISGQDNSLAVSKLQHKFKKIPIITGSNKPSGIQSTIVGLNDMHQVEVVREGSITKSSILNAIS